MLPASKTSSWSSPASTKPCSRPRVRNFFRGFGAVFYKEVLHVRRDPATLFFSLVIPLLQMVVLGFGIDTNIRQVNTVVYNADARRESRELIDRLKNSDTFHIWRYVGNDQDLNDAIIAGKARVGIKIPVDYSDRLLHNMSAQVLVLIDGSDSSVAGQAINVTTAIGLDESLRRVLEDRSTLAVDIRPKLLFNPDSRSPNFLLPGLTAILLLNVTTFLTAFSIVREKERGTLEQLFVTPVRPMGLLLGKLLPYLAIGFSELSLILSFMRFVFQVPIHGSVVLLAFLSLPYLFVSLSIGILVSSKANTQSEAIQLAFLTFLPSIFFSGYIFPRETMPTFFYVISYFIPASYYINITRGIILRGAGIAHLWIDGLALFAIGTILLIIAARRFQNKVIMA
ncbi:MAG: ABC transporter permease [Acidobacteria bacterium]|nr:MAG: ABC transporter permease [Acidobacteriota bacterium]PYU60368.1 MAG: ABC transporter permease [Acidobacteriota bacterium]